VHGKNGFAKVSKNQAVFQNSTKCNLHFDFRECDIIDISLSGAPQRRLRHRVFGGGGDQRRGRARRGKSKNVVSQEKNLSRYFYMRARLIDDLFQKILI